MSLRIRSFLAVFAFVVSVTHGALNVSIIREPEGDPPGVYQAATRVTLTCTHNGSSSATYSWTCSGESNCFTQDLMESSKSRGVLRGGDTGTHSCTVVSQGMTGTASISITVTGIGFSYRRIGASFRYAANNSAIFIPPFSGVGQSAGTYILQDLECASGTTSSSSGQLLFVTPAQYQTFLTSGLVHEPGLWKLGSDTSMKQFYLQSFTGGVFTCRMPDENGVVIDTSVGIFPDNYVENSLSVSLNYTQSGPTLTLNCTSTGLPPTTVTWRKDGLEMSSGDNYVFSQRVIDVDNIVYENMMIVNGGSVCDGQGVYQCFVQCHDDIEEIVNNATDSISVTVQPSCVASSLPSTTSSSSITSHTILSTSSSSSTPAFTESPVIVSSKKPSQATPTPIEATETQVTVSETPTEEGLPFSDEVLYAVVAAAAAILVLLLVCLVMCCCCICVKRRRNRKHDKESASEMQTFGMRPSEKATAKTLLNVINEVSQEDAESIPLIESEEIIAIPSSKSLSSVGHKHEDQEAKDKHEYEEIEVADHHEYEFMDAAATSSQVEEEDQKEEKHEKENEAEPMKMNGEEPEKGNGEESEKQNKEEEEESDTVDLEVTAIDVEDEEVDEEQKQEANIVDEENGTPAEGDSGSQKEEGISEVEIEPSPTPVDVEVEIESEGTPVTSSAHSVVDATVVVDEVASEQSAKGEPGEIPLSDFGEHVRKLHENNNELFLKEYESFPMRMTKPHEAGSSECNAKKNRFKDIVAYDHSRVLLREGPGITGTDYINANYLHGWKKENMYIATQGPTSKTIADFWRMVWEHKLSTIVMLTRCVEGGKTKCQQYWPNNLKMTSLYDSGVRVTLDNITSFAEYEYRKMTVKSSLEPDGPPLKVTHFQYTAWPDHGVPQQSNSLLAFIRRVRVSHPPGSTAPLLVHCSAGIGRTGTFIALDSLMMKMKDLQTLNVYKFVTEMREQRTQMVQTDVQYIFIHDALDELIKFGETFIELPRLPSMVMSFEDDKTVLNKQFMMLTECSPAVNEKNCSEGFSPANADKNRTNRIVPFDANRVTLRSTNWKEQQYINASFLDNYSHRTGFIATQTPLPNTVKDFWQMVWNIPCRVVVTLSEEEEKFLVMEKGTEVEVGQTIVVLELEEEENGYTKRVFQISNSLIATGHSEKKLTITQFQLRGLPTMAAGSSTTFLDMIDGVLKIQMATGNKPIVVMCPDGSGCSGVFMVVYSQLEKLKVEGMVDVFQCIKTLRTKRPGIVADVEQYELCFHILADYLSSVETYSNFQPSTAEV